MDLKKAVASLTERGFAVHYFETAAEAAAAIGGSVTLDQLGLVSGLCMHKKGNEDRGNEK